MLDLKMEKINEIDITIKQNKKLKLSRKGYTDTIQGDNLGNKMEDLDYKICIGPKEDRKYYFLNTKTKKNKEENKDNDKKNDIKKRKF